MREVIKFSFLLSLLIIASACSKDDPDKSELMFEEESAIGGENFSFAYYSPDPGCVGKIYDIKSNALAGEIVLNCKNSDNIIISECHTSNYELDVNDDWYEKSEKIFINKAAAWRMEVIDQSSIRIVLDPVLANSEDLTYAIQSSVMVTSADSKSKLRAKFHVTRFMTSVATIE